MKLQDGITSAGQRCKRQPSQIKNLNLCGFTLLELSIVLIIIAILSALMAAMGKEKISEARDIQTASKMDRLEQALMAYRLKNLRLPCPADRLLLPSDPNYGREAANAGRCTGGTPDVNDGNTYIDSSKLVAEGGVPFATLGLSEEFAYDAWERKITYAVALRYTEIEAFEVYDIYENCALITVRDASGATRSTKAAYVLLSSGPNGHGAFTKLGIRYNGGSTNLDELTNCKCTTAGVFNGPYTPTYVQKSLVQASVSSFDDIVRFKDRWQLQNDDDQLVLAYNGPETMLGIDQAPYVSFYSLSCDTYNIMTNPAITPTGAVLTTSVSPDDFYWAVGGVFSPTVIIYKLLNNGVLAKLLDPPFLPTTAVRGMAFSYNADFNFLGVAHDLDLTSAAVHLYQVAPGTDSFNYVAGQPDIQPSTGAKAIAFHPGGSYMAVVHSTGPYYMNIYFRTSLTFTHLNMASALSAAPGGTPVVVAFSPNGNYMAIGESSGNFLEIYKINLTTSVFTKLATQPASPGGVATAIAFDRKSRYLTVALNNGAASLATYRIDPSNDSFTTITGAGSSVNGLRSVAFSPRQNRWQDGETGANSANSGKYIPGDEYFPLPMATVLPSQGGSHANSVSIRYQLSTHLNTSYIY